jgi:formamidopyrimidine-DNA glycosylase
VPELPEVQAHAERLTALVAGRVLTSFEPLTFTALKTAAPPPDAAYGEPLARVARRGKYLLLEFPTVTFAVHLMQGGRLTVDERRAARPRGGQARFVFDEGPALLLTEAGTERRAGVWCLPSSAALATPPLDVLGPEPLDLDAGTLARRFTEHPMRLHGFLRDQRAIAGLGRRLANEVCHRARRSPFAPTDRLGEAGAAEVLAAIRDAIEEGLAAERARDDMSSSAERPGRVHGRAGEPCPVCGDTVRAVEYRDYTIC